METQMISIDDAIFQHLNQFWPESKIKRYVWEHGKIMQRLPEFSVYFIVPKDRNYFIYVSSGISNFLNQEFFIISPIETPEHVETLAMLASSCLDFPDSFKLGYSVNIGRPWIEHSRMTRLLISLPYLYGPKFEYMEYFDKKIRFLWLLPITENENIFLKNNCLDELEELFEQNNINYLEIDRNSVI